MQGKNKMCAVITVKMIKTKRQATTFLTADHTWVSLYSDPSRSKWAQCIYLMGQRIQDSSYGPCLSSLCRPLLVSWPM